MLKHQDIYRQAGFGGAVRWGKRPAVIVVDFTFGFTDTRYPTAAGMAEEMANTSKIVKAARNQGRPVVFTSIAYQPAEIPALPWLRKSTGMADLLIDSQLVKVDPHCGYRPDDVVLYKTGASAFFGTHLTALLTGWRADTVIVTGATTSGCVRATAIDAVQSGFDVLVPRDCVADRAAAPHAASLYDLAQKYADVTESSTVCAYLDRLLGPNTEGIANSNGATS